MSQAPTLTPRSARTGADDDKLARLRAQLPATAATAYFNAGTNGPLPVCAHQAVVSAARQELTAGRIVPGVYEGHAQRNDRIRDLIAEIFSANPSEIALTRSTNEGLNIVLSGITWQPGDEVITTNLEHPGLLRPLGLLAHRHGIVLRVADIGNGGGDVVAALAAQLNSRTRLVALSHVMWSSGAIMPLADIASLAHDHGALILVDAAQSAGQVPVDLHGLAVDAYAMSGQKWLCGPEGTGVLFIREDRFADIQPTHIRYGESDPAGWLLPAPGARRYEMGEAYAPAILGLEATLTWLRDEVGLDWMYERTAALGRQCWEGFAGLDVVTLALPNAKIAGLVCFTVEGLTPQELTAKLYERGMTIRYVAYPPGPTVARAAVGWWNTEAEVDQLVEAVSSIVCERVASP